MRVTFRGGPQDGEQVEVEDSADHVRVERFTGTSVLRGEYFPHGDPNRNPLDWDFGGFSQFTLATFEGGPVPGTHEVPEGIRSMVVVAEGGVVSGYYNPSDDPGTWLFNPADPA